MISISDNDGKIIEFLIKNYSSRYTTREIGLKLKISPAGSYKSLKKLEKDSIVLAEKLGTGLFFHINYQNPIAFYLSCFVASQSEEENISLKEHVRAIIQNKDSALIISHHHDENLVKALAVKHYGPKATVISEEEFTKKIVMKDSQTVEILRDSKFLHGAEYIIKAITKAIR